MRLQHVAPRPSVLILPRRPKRTNPERHGATRGSTPAESVGFEPTDRFDTINALAGRPIRPLWQLSAAHASRALRQPPSAIRHQIHHVSGVETAAADTDQAATAAGKISKCASVGAWLLIFKMSCGQHDITAMQSSTARKTT